METSITWGSWGYRVEWYREDDSGNGQLAVWYGSREDCETRAKSPPDDAWWQPLRTERCFDADRYRDAY